MFRGDLRVVAMDGRTRALHTVVFSESFPVLNGFFENTEGKRTVAPRDCGWGGPSDNLIHIVVNVLQ